MIKGKPIFTRVPKCVICGSKKVTRMKKGEWKCRQCFTIREFADFDEVLI